MLRGLLTAGLMLLSSSAYAQGSCSMGVGVAGAAAPAGRSWDMSTPGPWATGTTPASNLRCNLEGMWIGVEATPLLRHSYRSLGGRGPMMVTTTIGGAFRLDDRTTVGNMLVSNGAARGYGIGVTHRIGRINWQESKGPTALLDVRLYRMWGLNPTYTAMATLHIMQWDTDKNPGRRALGGHIRHGLTSGTVTGARIEWTPDFKGDLAWNDIGLRVGTLHNRRAGMELQPIALGFWDISLDAVAVAQLGLTGGATLRDGAIRPVGGASLQVQSLEVPVQSHVGFLIVPGEGRCWTPDIGISVVW